MEKPCSHLLFLPANLLASEPLSEQSLLNIVLSPSLTANDVRLAVKSIPRQLMRDGAVIVSDLHEARINEFVHELRSFADRSLSDLVLVVFEPIVFESLGFRALVQRVDDLTADVTYFDSRKLARPEFSPERLRGQDYLGGVLAFRTEWLRNLGELESEEPAVVKLEIVLSAFRQGAMILHSSVPLTKHNRGRESFLKPEVEAALRDVVQRHLDATGGGQVIAVESQVLYPSRRVSHGEPLVSIVIPTQGLWSPGEITRRSYLLDAARSIVTKTTYTNYEVVVVVDSGADQEVIAELESLFRDKLRLVWWEHPFNFSAKVNLGVVHATGEFVVLLNDDVEVITPDWIETMLALAQRDTVGIVGSMLYFGDDTIQHAGHAYVRGNPTHIALGLPRGSGGLGNGLFVERELSGVTAACAMLRRDVFFEAGGLTSLLPGNFNDLDLCMKLSRLGYAILWTPFAELYHFESKTRDAQVHWWELDIIGHRWGDKLDDSRYWPGNPLSTA